MKIAPNAAKLRGGGCWRAGRKEKKSDLDGFLGGFGGDLVVWGRWGCLKRAVLRV